MAVTSECSAPQKGGCCCANCTAICHPSRGPHPEPGKPLWPGSPWASLLGSFLCTCFGNAFQSVPVLVWLQPFFLLRALLLHFDGRRGQHHCGSAMLSVAFVVLVVVVQAAGTTVAVGPNILPDYLMNLQERLVLTFKLGVLGWTLAMMLSYLPFVICTRRMPCSWIQPLIFPTGWTALLVISYYTSLLTSFPGNARDLADDLSFVQVAALVGLEGATFLYSWVASTAATLLTNSHGHHGRPHPGPHPGPNPAPGPHPDTHHHFCFRKLFVRAMVAVLFGVLIYGGFRFVWDQIYMKNLPAMVPPMTQMTCLAKEAASAVNVSSWRPLLDTTQARIEAGDDLVMWSECMVAVDSQEMEAEFIRSAQAAVSKAAGNALVGVTYYLSTANKSENYNYFLLLHPNGTLAWKYAKTYLVPYMEDSGQPGPGILPVLDTEKFGRISGSICFDMEFPELIRQAGKAKVDFMLQPAGSWGSEGPWAYRMESWRTVENGFGWFRCAYGGISGVMGPNHQSYHYHSTAYDDIFTVQVPRFHHSDTIYVRGGWMFGPACVVLTAFFLFTVLCHCGGRKSWCGGDAAAYDLVACEGF